MCIWRMRVQEFHKWIGFCQILSPNPNKKNPKPVRIRTKFHLPEPIRSEWIADPIRPDPILTEIFHFLRSKNAIIIATFLCPSHNYLSQGNAYLVPSKDGWFLVYSVVGSVRLKLSNPNPIRSEWSKSETDPNPKKTSPIRSESDFGSDWIGFGPDFGSDCTALTSS